MTLVKGDSAQEIPRILAGIHTPALFWLDGHYTDETSGQAAVDTAISAELAAVLAHPVRHVILIDDARLFNGEWDYPRLEDLVAQVRAQGHYDVEVSADIIRLTPLSAGHSPGTFAGG